MFVFIIAYLILTIIRPQDYMPAVAAILPLQITLIVAFLFWLGAREKPLAHPQFLLLPGFLVIMMLSQIFAGWFGGALLVLQRIGPMVIAFFVLATACNTRRRVTWAIGVYAICAVILALHGLLQERNGIGWTGVPLSQDSRIQYVGIFNDPNDLGLLFVTALPMAFLLSARGGFIGRLFWWAAAGLLLYGIYLTNSRGALLAVAAVAAVYLWLRRGVVTALVFGSVGLMGMMMLPSRLQDLDVEESSAFGRVDAWYAGLHMFTSHPLFGVGAGNFTEYNDLTAHNSFVLVLAETGFIGYVTWMAFIGTCFWMMWTILHHKPEMVEGDIRASEWKSERGLAMTLFLSFCGFFAAAFFLSRSYIVLLYLLAAILVGHYVGVRGRFESLQEFPLFYGWLRWPAIAVVSIAALFVIVAVLLRTS